MSSIDRSRPPAERRRTYALGQAKYKKGAYQLAIEHFTKALEGARSDGVSDEKVIKAEIYRLLSARASTYTQMGDLKNAKNDLKECIQLEPKDYRAYLSSATIFARENRFDKAYRFMDRADEMSPTERLESNKRSRKSIEAAEATYLASLGPKRIDPVEVLPLEVFGRILELGVDDNEPNFPLRPSWVSVKWRAAALASSPAWKFFQWISYHPVTTRTQALLSKADAWHERSKGNIDRCDLDFNRTRPCPLPRMFPKLDMWLPRVRELSLDDHCPDKHARTSTCLETYAGKQAGLCRILRAREQDVRFLIPSGNTTLRRLDTSTGYNDYDVGIGIPEDRLESVRYWTVEMQAITAQFRFQDMRMMQELISLRVIEDNRFSCGHPDCLNLLYDVPEEWPPADLIRLPKLEVLLGLPLVYLQGLECPALVCLELATPCGCIPALRDDPIAFLQRSSVDLTKIERLVLSKLGNFSSKILGDILPCLRSLDCLDIKECITNDVVEMLADLTRFPKLRVVFIRDARGLTGGPILRMVESRLKAQRTRTEDSLPKSDIETIKQLQLLNCDMLEKAAEDWLKRNVPRAVITHIKQPKAGYRDKMASR